MKFSKNPLAWVFSLAFVLYIVLTGDTEAGAFVLATSPFVDLAGACAQITRQLSDLTKQNTPFGLARRTGALDLVLSPDNGSIKLDLTNTQAGKKYVKTKLHYKTRTKSCEWLTDANVPSVCDQGAEPEENSVTVNINKHFSSPLRSFSNSNMVNICQDTQQFVNEYILNDMRAGREKIDEYILSQIDSNVGRITHQDGSADTPPGGHKVKRILGTDATTGTQVPLFANYADVLLDYQYNQFNGVPMLLGDGYLQKFFMLSKFSCCNADGVAYDSAIAEAGAAFYLDPAASTYFGANSFVMVAPNTVHLMWFNENQNINIDTPLRRQIVVNDPIYPQLKWDLDFEYTCDKVWTYKISAWADTFIAIQSDAFGTDNSPQNACEDQLAGVNGIFGYTATNA